MLQEKHVEGVALVPKRAKLILYVGVVSEVRNRPTTFNKAEELSVSKEDRKRGSSFTWKREVSPAGRRSERTPVGLGIPPCLDKWLQEWRKDSIVLE